MAQRRDRVREARGQIQRRLVKVGTVTDDGVSIASGLDGTERVVVLAGALVRSM